MTLLFALRELYKPLYRINIKEVFIMLYLFAYLLTGLIIIYVVAFGHLMRAEMKGYAAIDWWNTHKHEVFSQGKKLILPFMTGLFVWPLRLVNMIMVIIPECYDLYERREFM